MYRFLRVPAFVSLLLSVAPLIAQQIEQYEGRRESERLRPNRFLFEETGERKDLLQRYYQNLFLESAKGKIPKLTPYEEDLLLKQLKPTLAMEGPIDPSQYIVGPFDGVSVNLWAGIPLSFSTFITPEGTLIIPTVGEISVAGRTLKEVKEIVAKEVGKKYPKGEVSATLISPRTFIVKVAGVVSKPGAYIVSSVDRVDKAIFLSNLSAILDRETQIPEQLMLPPRRVDGGQIPMHYRYEEFTVEHKPSLRNIQLVRASGDTLNVDLIRYYAAGDVTSNPFLQDGDVVIVPSEDLEANTVSIQGAVRLPGRFEYQPYDSLSLMFKIANGPAAAANLENAELVRLRPDGKTYEKIPINIRKILSGEMDLALQPNDRIFVRWNKNLREDHTVTIKGEVQHPGDYAISRYETMLSEVIEQAGGFTSEAAISECKILRKNNSEDTLAKNADYARLSEMRLSGMNKAEREYYTYESAIRRDFVSADFKRLFVDGERTADVTLRNGDVILVPSRNRSVYVSGQVANPGYVTYLTGPDYKYYIEKAGGYSRAADKDKVSLIKAGTKKWVDAEGQAVEEGDGIFVFLRPERAVTYYFALVRDILTVATAGATLYFLISQARR